MTTQIILRYIGNGSYVAGIPATDLTAADITASGFAIEQIKALQDNGNALYVPVDKAPANNAGDNDEVNYA